MSRKRRFIGSSVPLRTSASSRPAEMPEGSHEYEDAGIKHSHPATMGVGSRWRIPCSDVSPGLGSRSATAPVAASGLTAVDRRDQTFARPAGMEFRSVAAFGLDMK